MTPSDGELLAACRRGDEAAWGALVRRYQRLIYAIPRRAGLGEELSAEVFQEVFTTLFERLDDIEQPERLRAWLVTTARRKTARMIGRERHSAARHGGDEAGDESLAELPDPSVLPDEALLQLEEQHRVRTALSSLDERCRRLLVMLFYAHEPPPYSEIAAALNVPEGSIGPTRARCLKKLLRLLEI